MWEMGMGQQPRILVSGVLKAGTTIMSENRDPTIGGD